MGLRKCDQCEKEIHKEAEHILHVPDEYCEHCDSETYAEYDFCSKKCTKEWLNEN